MSFSLGFVHSSDCAARTCCVLPSGSMPSGSSARGRSPVQQKDFRKARDELANTKDRVEQLEKRLGSVGGLAVQTAQDVAVLRAELQVVFFASGSARAALEAELAEYNEGKAAVANGTADRGAPLKVRMYRTLLRCVEEQASPYPTTQESVRSLRSFDASWAIGSLSNANRPPPEGKPWVLLCTFAASESGRALRRLWGAAPLATLWTKQPDGQWPPVGVKPGVPRPSRKVVVAADAVGIQLKGKGFGKGAGPSTRISPKRSASGDGAGSRRSRRRSLACTFSGSCLYYLTVRFRSRPGAGSGLVQAPTSQFLVGFRSRPGPSAGFRSCPGPFIRASVAGAGLWVWGASCRCAGLVRGSGTVCLLVLLPPPLSPLSSFDAVSARAGCYAGSGTSH